MKSIFLRRIVIIVGFISIIYILMRKMIKSRGLKNNNPFNLVKSSTRWYGEIDGIDEKFCTFSSLDLGVRAGLINLYTGYFSKSLTVRRLVMKYSPPEDNISKSDPDGMKSVEAYIGAISKRTLLSDSMVPIKSQWLSVASAMLYHENGISVKSEVELLVVSKLYNLVNYI
jgi:hypothetical protein